MTINYDLSQASTKRGIILVIFSILAVIEILKNNVIAATAIMAVGQQLAGWLGIVLSDKPNETTN